jgi:hypothetical protein
MSYNPKVFTQTINGTSMVEVSKESDFGVVGAVTAGAIVLDGNTTYIVRGNVDCANRLIADEEGISIIGSDRDKDGLTYTPTSSAVDFITVDNVNFEMESLKMSSNNTTAGKVILRADNFDYTAGVYNAGRTKVFTLINMQFRNCYDVWHIEGFDLVDIQNCLIWYIQASGMGCHFHNNSKLQLTSCEYVRWFDETNVSVPVYAETGTAYVIGNKVRFGPSFYIATADSASPNAGTFDAGDWSPTGYSTVSMVELIDNTTGGAGDVGFGAVNITGCIFHPQQTQNGINIKPGSTTGFGTVSSNTFVNVGLVPGTSPTVGEVFVGNDLTPAGGTGAYNSEECLKYDILANNGILNSTAGVVATVQGGNTNMSLGINAPQKVDIGTLQLPRAAVRFSAATNGTLTYNGTKQIYCSIHISVIYDKSGGGGDNYTFSLRKGSAGGSAVLLPGSEQPIRASGNAGALGITYGSLFDTGDFVELWIETPDPAADDITVTGWQFLIRE